MLGSAMVGALSGPPDSMTRTCAPEADNSAARTEPAAPAPTTMKSYRLSSFESLIILNSQYLKSDFLDSRLEGSTLSRTDHRCATPEVPCGPSHCRELSPSAPDLAADQQLGGSEDLPGLARCKPSG